MKKSSTSGRNSGTYTSPGTPEYGDNYGGRIQKGWSSERVPLPATNSSRRHVSAAALMPFNNSGRTLPSKWDDAERWITSPVSGYGVCKNSFVPTQRRPKSKSGPLGTPGLVYFSHYSPSHYSPAIPVLEGGTVRNFMGSSPLTTGVLVPDGVAIHYGGGISAKSTPLYAENGMAQSSSAPGLSDLLSEHSQQSSGDDKLDDHNEAECVVSRRDMATQMSPDGSTHSSPTGKSLVSTYPSTLEQQARHTSIVEVRDVQVDKGAMVARKSRKHGTRKMKKGSLVVENSTSSWHVAEGGKNTTKLQREEARITAWENLQKAKAEAAIQKLEMKLEKKRSSSMDKILNKLRIAQMKAQEMRSSVSEDHAHQVSSASHKVVSFRRYVKVGPFGGCFFCHNYSSNA